MFLPVVSWMAAFPGELAAQVESASLFRAETRLVTVGFYALRQGRVVFDLKPEDVRVFEDGIEQTIAIFDPPVPGAAERTQAPVHALILLDVSGTVTGGGLFDARMLQSAFLANLQSRAEISIYSFAKECQRLCPPTRDFGVLTSALSDAARQKSDGTSLYRSIVQVVQEAETAPPTAHRVLFVISDGLPDGDRTSSKEAADAALSAGVRIYPVLLRHSAQNISGDEARDSAMRRSHEMRLKEFTDLGRATGGRSFDPYPILNRGVLAQILESVADQLRVEYSLGYYSKAPAAKPKRRSVTVKIRDSSMGRLYGGTRSVVR